MPTGYLLLDRPNPNYKQYRETRRNGAKNSGVVVVHTAENVTDIIGADAGAEGVGNYLTSRNTPGSYHVLCDSDSTIYCAPWWYETWHDTRTNPHAVGISGAVASADWNRLGERGDRIVIRMARAAREYANWLKANRGIVIPARLITQAQAMALVPGFVAHGTMDPGRRSDPGKDFDWSLFLEVFSNGSVEEEDDMFEQTDRDMLNNVYAAIFNGGPDTPNRESILTLLQKTPERVGGLVTTRKVGEEITETPFIQEVADIKTLLLSGLQVDVTPVIEAVRETIRATPQTADLSDDDVDELATKVVMRLGETITHTQDKE